MTSPPKSRKRRIWKRILIGVVSLILIGAAYGWYLFTKRPPDTRKMAAAYSLDAAKLVSEYKADEKAADKRYVDKVVEVSGKIISIEKNEKQATVTLDGNDMMAYVTCSFYDDEMASLDQVSPGQTIRVKGNCTGMLTDIILNKCSIVP